ncbi:hypothetical protein SORBI_3001G020800 [Sorghum bicolor]|uniref:Uncharacterized protein n=1 Tax=Sorghum bicolor TaxID=4558 RepID=A0A1B6QGX9_SORBI|nr:hypothetical protein SORBI_3001G020800 [Sorghum bicolor]
MHVDHGCLGARLALEAPPADAHHGRVPLSAPGALGGALEHLPPRRGRRLLFRRRLRLPRRVEPRGAAGAPHAFPPLPAPDHAAELVLAGGAVDEDGLARLLHRRLHHHQHRHLRPRRPAGLGSGGRRRRGSARVPVRRSGAGGGGPRWREGFIVCLPQKPEGALGGGAVGLVRVHEERQPPELLLDGVLRGGVGAGAYAEDRAPAAGAAVRGGVGVDLVCRDRVVHVRERRAEPLRVLGHFVRVDDFAGEEELLLSSSRYTPPCGSLLDWIGLVWRWTQPALCMAREIYSCLFISWTPIGVGVFVSARRAFQSESSPNCPGNTGLRSGIAAVYRTSLLSLSLYNSKLFLREEANECF